ncbi:hypothetical protein ABC347_07895 [Sphingomonas sp. 1P06PA]|uniref:hypothetical protein n=1 Tax=Sphingomonas sp. 1P06PA TaxID=554121 RepID=UPI0039A628C4
MAWALGITFFVIAIFAFALCLAARRADDRIAQFLADDNTRQQLGNQVGDVASFEHEGVDK